MGGGGSEGIRAAKEGAGKGEKGRERERGGIRRDRKDGGDGEKP